MSKQTRILGALRQGPCTAAQLDGITLGYRQRLSDLRKRGYIIDAFEVRRRDGTRVTTYRLVSEPSERGTAIEPAGVNNSGVMSPRCEGSDRLFDVEPTKPKPANAISGEWGSE